MLIHLILHRVCPQQGALFKINCLIYIVSDIRIFIFRLLFYTSIKITDTIYFNILSRIIVKCLIYNNLSLIQIKSVNECIFMYLFRFNIYDTKNTPSDAHYYCLSRDDGKYHLDSTKEIVELAKFRLNLIAQFTYKMNTFLFYKMDIFI